MQLIPNQNLYRYAFSGVEGWDPFYIYAQSELAAWESLKDQFGDEYVEERVKLVKREPW